MDLRSLVQDILSEVSPKISNFQIELDLLITWVRSSVYIRFIESLRTCTMASQSRITFVDYVMLIFAGCVMHEKLVPYSANHSFHKRTIVLETSLS